MAEKEVKNIDETLENIREIISAGDEQLNETFCLTTPISNALRDSAKTKYLEAISKCLVVIAERLKTVPEINSVGKVEKEN